MLDKDKCKCNWGGLCGPCAAQLVIVPCPAVQLVEVEELSETNRGSGGFGSTGVSR